MVVVGVARMMKSPFIDRSVTVVTVTWSPAAKPWAAAVVTVTTSSVRAAGRDGLGVGGRVGRVVRVGDVVDVPVGVDRQTGLSLKYTVPISSTSCPARAMTMWSIRFVPVIGPPYGVGPLSVVATYTIGPDTFARP